MSTPTRTQLALFAAGDDLPLFTGLGDEDPDVMPLLAGEPTAVDEAALCECGHVRGRHGLFCGFGGAARDDEPWSWCADCGGLCEFRPAAGAVAATADDPGVCPDCWHEHPEGEPCPPIGRVAVVIAFAPGCRPRTAVGTPCVVCGKPLTAALLRVRPWADTCNQPCFLRRVLAEMPEWQLEADRRTWSAHRDGRSSR